MSSETQDKPPGSVRPSLGTAAGDAIRDLRESLDAALRRLGENDEEITALREALKLARTMYRRQETAPDCKMDQYEPGSLMDQVIEAALNPQNTELSGGGPLSNKTTEAESRRPLD